MYCAQIKTITENITELLVWRDKQNPTDDPSLLIWKPEVTEHQLSINTIPSPSTFNLDLGRLLHQGLGGAKGRVYLLCGDAMRPTPAGPEGFLPKQTSPNNWTHQAARFPDVYG